MESLQELAERHKQEVAVLRAIVAGSTSDITSEVMQQHVQMLAMGAGDLHVPCLIITRADDVIDAITFTHNSQQDKTHRECCHLGKQPDVGLNQ
jgi:hypothetical protein